MGAGRTRDIIIEEGLLRYIDEVAFSDVKKDAIRLFSEGESMASVVKALGKYKGFTTKVVLDFISKCSKITGIWYSDPERVGDVMSQNVQWKVRYENSLIQPVREVLDVNTNEYTAGQR